MVYQNDPYVIYNGEVEEPGSYATIGDLFVRSFKKGGNKPALVKYSI